MSVSKTDNELMTIADEKVSWKMITGNKTIYPTYRTLKDALIFLSETHKSGKSIGPLEKTDGSIYIDLPQIETLWKLLNIS